MSDGAFQKAMKQKYRGLLFLRGLIILGARESGWFSSFSGTSRKGPDCHLAAFKILTGSLPNESLKKADVKIIDLSFFPCPPLKVFLDGIVQGKDWEDY